MAMLFITSTHIGDAVLSTGLLAHLLSRHPEQRVTIACGAPAAKVFAATPRLDAIHVLRKQRHHRHWAELWRKTRGTRWDVLVDLRRSIMPWLLRAGQKRVLPKPRGTMHRVELIASTLGLPPQDPVVWTGPEHEERARGLIDGKGETILALAPGATWAGKVWPADRFAELARRLSAPGGPLPDARVLLVGSQDERAPARALVEGLPGGQAIDAFGLDVLSTYAALRRCRLMVGNDSAMMHLAAASGIPTVGLFGPTRDEHYAPWGPAAMVVRTPQSVEELTGHPDYDTRTTGSLMTGLEVARVEAAILKRWPRLGRSAAAAGSLMPPSSRRRPSGCGR